MSKLVLTLEEEDLLDLQQILLDDDAADALHFLKTRIAPKIPAQGTSLCDSSRRNPFLLKSDGNT
ncbi:MAG: hypothetical protein ACYC9O_04475 [Candidatus Latescibacterota bacterium]